jgi:hypothetical protein
MENVKDYDPNYLPHFAKKLFEIYGLTESSPGRMTRDICRGNARFCCLSANPGRNFYWVKVAGIDVKVLFDESDKVCVTVVPPEFRGKVFKRAKARMKKQFFRDIEDDEEDGDENE